MRWLAILLFAALATVLAGLVAREDPQIAVENRSGQTAVSIRLLVGERAAAFDPIGPGELTRQSVPLLTEGPARLVVEWEGAAACTLQAGYFAPGQRDVSRLVIVSRDSVVFVPR